jgi:transposase
VDEKYTSKTCHKCGYIKESLWLMIRSFALNVILLIIEM